VKKIVYIHIFVLFLSFNSIGQELKELNNENAYLLINEYFKKDISDQSGIFLFRDLQLNQPEYSTTEFDFEKEKMELDSLDEFFFKDFETKNTTLKTSKKNTENGKYQPIENDKIIFPQSRFGKGKWNPKLLDRITVLDYSIFDTKNDEETEIKLFKKRYGTNIVHNVSYPIYNPKTKIAIILDNPDNISTDLNCVPITYCYIYLKEKDGWKSLKEFGTINIYLTLYYYYNSTSR